MAVNNNWSDTPEWRHKVYDNIQYRLETNITHLDSLRNVRLALKCNQPDKPGCRGRAIMHNGRLRITTRHSHRGHRGLLNSKIAEDFAKDIAGHTLRPIAELQRELSLREPCLSGHDNSMWTPDRMRTQMTRSRKAMRPPNVHGSLNELHDVLNSAEWAPLLSSLRGQLTENTYNVQGNPLMVLYHENIIDEIAASAELHIGSSSYKKPPGIAEVVIVSVAHNARLYKCLWFLLSVKSRAAYDQIIQITRQKFAYVTNVFTSWDLDLIMACRQIWPNSHGTWYSYAKTIRHIAMQDNIDLSDSENNQIAFRKLMALALLPPNIIERQFGGLVVAMQRHETINTFQRVLDFIFNVYLRVIGPAEMSCAINDNRDDLQQLRLGWYEINDEMLLDSLDGIRADDPSLYQYLEYIIRANEKILKDFTRQANESFSLFSPKIIRTTRELRQLSFIWADLARGLSPQRALCQFSAFLRVPTDNLLYDPQPLVEGFRVSDADNGVENIFDGIAAPPAPGLFLFVEENDYRPPRIRHAQVQEEDSADDTSDEERIDDQPNVVNVAPVNDEIDDEENWEVLEDSDDNNDDDNVAEIDDERLARIVGDIGVPAQDRENAMCVICQADDSLPDRDLRTLEECPHLFCHRCIRRWALRHRTCPICRGPF